MYIQSIMFNYSKKACLLCCIEYLIFKEKLNEFDLIKDYQKLINYKVIDEDWNIIDANNIFKYYNINKKLVKISKEDVKNYDLIIANKSFKEHTHSYVINNKFETVYDSVKDCKAMIGDFSSFYVLK